MTATESPTSTANTSDIAWLVLFCAWLIAFVGTLGSLFFSHVMDFAPCLLCWYQRICLFPLVLILARGLFPFDPSAVRYALPLASVGWCVAAYHSMIYAGWIPDDMQPCSQGVSCSEVHIELLGFLSIPYLSLLAFTALSTLLIISHRRTTT